jgi:hypothetical protein
MIANLRTHLALFTPRLMRLCDDVCPLKDTSNPLFCTNKLKLDTETGGLTLFTYVENKLWVHFYV